MIVIIDYKLGNKASIANMVKKIGYDAIITNDIELISQATKIILPGVGAFDEGMKNIAELGLDSILKQKVLVEKTPILGICLGMQLLCSWSEEGNLLGLGFIDATFKKFPKDINGNKLRTPHLGWNTITNTNTRLLANIINPRFYFVHSYYCSVTDATYSIEHTQYGIEFISLFEHENIFGVQFHPEKSHSNGKQLLQNFLSL